MTSRDLSRTELYRAGLSGLPVDGRMDDSGNDRVALHLRRHTSPSFGADQQAEARRTGGDARFQRYRLTQPRVR